jgi:hypothetical protein
MVSQLFCGFVGRIGAKPGAAIMLVIFERKMGKY